MNERIKALAEKAGMTNDKFGMFFALDKHNEDGVDLELFVELFVRECMEQVWYTREDYINENISEVIKERMKQHFGVKE